MTIILNGEPHPLPESLIALLQQRNISPQQQGIAVAVNGVVIPRANWQEKSLVEGDRVDIVRAIAGG